MQDRRAGDGAFSTFAHGAAPFASLYQLARKQIEQGVPSHWAPYVSVPDVDAAAATASGLGGQVIVPPHDAGLARISLICDPAGALIGLWQRPGHSGEHTQANSISCRPKGLGQHDRRRGHPPQRQLCLDGDRAHRGVPQRRLPVARLEGRGRETALPRHDRLARWRSRHQPLSDAVCCRRSPSAASRRPT